jgi:hypothetical protein
MQRFISRRPSGAMMVAFLALFVAMGGSATALKGRNGVKKDDIVRGGVGTSEAANNSLRTQDIRNRTLLDRDHRRNGLTGASINEATLGTVPGAFAATNAVNAGRASTAGSADRAGSAGQADAVTGLTRLGRIAMSIGEERDIARFGPFRFTATCEDLGGGSYQARIFVENVGPDDATLESNSNDEYDFDSGEEVFVATASSNAASTSGPGDGDATFGAISSDGTALTGESVVSVHTTGSDCAVTLKVIS